MYLLGKRIDQIRPEDIKRLIENQVQENISLDYKVKLDIAKDADKKEFLFDIASMMNAEGGCIIFGIKEKKDDKTQNTSIPEEIIGVSIDNEDKFKQQIEDIIKTSTDPQRSNISIKFVEVEGKKILIIGISKGLGFPTMITYGGTNKFYKRRNSGKYPVDVHELNQMFMQNGDIVEKTTNFITTRIDRIITGKVFPNIDTQSSFFIHIFPFNFDTGNVLDLSTASEMHLDDLMWPMKTAGHQQGHFNVNGYCVTSQSLSDRKVFAYDQLFRNGVYEAYTAGIFEKYTTYGGREAIYRMEGKAFILTALDKIKKGLSVLKKFQIEPPFIISLTLKGMENGVIMDDHEWSQQKFIEDGIMFAPQVLPTFEADTYKFFKPTFDILWQAIGKAKSPDMEF